MPWDRKQPVWAAMSDPVMRRKMDLWNLRCVQPGVKLDTFSKPPGACAEVAREASHLARRLFKDLSARQRLAEAASRLVPCYRWISQYNDPAHGGWRARLQTDIIAGLAVSFLVVPQAFSYAQVAGLPPQYGLCTSPAHHPHIACKHYFTSTPIDALKLNWSRLGAQTYATPVRCALQIQTFCRAFSTFFLARQCICRLANHPRLFYPSVYRAAAANPPDEHSLTGLRAVLILGRVCSPASLPPLPSLRPFWLAGRRGCGGLASDEQHSQARAAACPPAQPARRSPHLAPAHRRCGSICRLSEAPAAPPQTSLGAGIRAPVLGGHGRTGGGVGGHIQRE